MKKEKLKFNNRKISLKCKHANYNQKALIDWFIYIWNNHSKSGYSTAVGEMILFYFMSIHSGECENKNC